MNCGYWLFSGEGEGGTDLDVVRELLAVRPEGERGACRKSRGCQRYSGPRKNCMHKRN